MFDGILFDLDGTLWDTTAVVVDCWADILARHPEISRPTITADDVHGCMGLLMEDLGRKLFPQLDPGDCADLVEELCQRESFYLPHRSDLLYPQVEETLALLGRDARLFIVSNCHGGYIPSFYAGHGLERYFTGSLCPAETGLPKSGNIAEVVRRYGLERPVYVGDTQLDYTSARDAGVPFLHAAYGFGTIDVPVPSAARFADIPAALSDMCPP